MNRFIGLAALTLPRLATFKFQSKSTSSTANASQYKKMAEQFVGKWNLVSSDNFDEYMKKVGIGLITRKMANSLKPVLTIEVSGEHWKITSASTFKTTVLEFDLNKEFDETTPDGRTMKSIFNWEDGKLVQQQKKIKADDKESKFERYIDGGKLVVTCECEGVKSTRTYQKE